MTGHELYSYFYLTYILGLFGLYFRCMILFAPTNLFIYPSGGVQIDTKDILFICGGAFVELEKTISER